MSLVIIEQKNIVDGNPVSLVYDMNKTAQNGHVNERSMKVIVKSGFKCDTIKIPDQNESKRATLIHYI